MSCYFGIGLGDRHYSVEYRRQRNLSLSVLKELGFDKDVMEERIQVEVSVLLQKIRDAKSEAFCPVDALVAFSVNATVSMVFGRRMEREVIAELAKVSYDYTQALLDTAPADMLPLLRLLPQMRRGVANATDLQNKLFDIIRSNIETADEDSFVRYYKNREGSKLDREQLEYIIRDVFMAGSETVTTALLWVLVLLAGPDGQRVQERLWKEIDSQVPRERLPSLADRPHLPFLEATILEIMRIKTVLPLGVSHQTSRDTTVGGCFIPANTLASIFLLVTYIHMYHVRHRKLHRLIFFRNSFVKTSYILTIFGTCIGLLQ